MNPPLISSRKMSGPFKIDKLFGQSVLWVRWVVLAACVCGLTAHLLIDSLGLPLSEVSPVQSAFAGLAPEVAHHDHFYLSVWQPIPQPVNRMALTPLQGILHHFRSSSPPLPPPKALTTA